jgi:drug/metabolite transporter (DMT)-like permease
VASSAGIDAAHAAAHPRGPQREWIGALCAIVGVLGFSGKAILVKLVYLAAPVDPTTLLALRMLYSGPLFAAMALWAGRQPGARRLTQADWLALAGLGFVGYYLASLLDFIGLLYVTASLERLILVRLPDDRRVPVRGLPAPPDHAAALGAVALCYGGVALAFVHDAKVGGDSARRSRRPACFGSAVAYAVYLVCSGRTIARLGSLRFVAWAMLASTAFIFVHFALVRPLSALDVAPRIHGLTIAMAVLSTVLPTWLIAESIRRLGANTASLIGSLGPVFTIALGVWLLGEPCTRCRSAALRWCSLGRRAGHAQAARVAGRRRRRVARPL